MPGRASCLQATADKLNLHKGCKKKKKVELLLKGPGSKEGDSWEKEKGVGDGWEEGYGGGASKNK